MCAWCADTRCSWWLLTETIWSENIISWWWVCCTYQIINHCWIWWYRRCDWCALEPQHMCSDVHSTNASISEYADKTSSVDEIWCGSQLTNQRFAWLDTQALWSMWTESKYSAQLCRTSMQAQLGDTCCVRCWLRHVIIKDHHLMSIWGYACQLSNYCWTWGHMLWVQVHISRKLCLCDQVNVEPESDQIINWWCITKFRVQSAASGQQVSAADALMLCASECCTGQGIRLWAQCTTSARAITPMIVLVSSYHAASISASSTQLGMHWFYALLH